jgi:ubiquinone/menaquinone biosynthesis C-methylase UbiE
MSNSYEAVRGHFSAEAERGVWSSFYEKGHDKEITSRSWPFLMRARRVIELLRTSGKEIKELLDVGCGTAPIAENIMAMGSRYTGTDFSPQMIEVANQKLATAVRSGKAILQVGDVRKLDFPTGAFDALTAMGVIEYLQEQDINQVLREMERVLSPGGVAVITIPKRWHWGSMITLIRLAFYYLKSKARTAFGKNKSGQEQGWERIYLTPGDLDRACEKAGLHRIDYRHYNAQLICPPFTVWMPRFSYLVNRPLENLATAPGFRGFASGYIGIYKKP